MSRVPSGITQAAWVVALVSMFAAAPRSAFADFGDTHLELSTGYRSGDGVDVLGGVRIGLGDFVSTRVLTGFRLDPDDVVAGRFEFTAGYAFDVLTWVPELSAGAAINVDDEEVVLTGLAFLSLRRYRSRDSFIAFELGGEITPDDEGLMLRLAFGF